MKYFLGLIFLVSIFVLSGCSTYVVDSRPRGLRVSVNNVERGVTPYEFKWLHGGEYETRIIHVTPPTRQQLHDYEKQNNKIVSVWKTDEMSKIIYSPGGGGTVLFNFITSEYDQPQTPEEAKWVEEAIQKDAEDLEKQRELILKQK
jgi:hypothetical protein